MSKDMGMRPRPLTVVSLDKLAAAISRAVTDVTDEECETRIVRIDFESEPFARFHDTTMLTLRLSLPHWSEWDEEENDAATDTDSASLSSEAPQG
jgi:hypothetical protein